MSLALLAWALSASLAADVPFVPQTPDLCGGAAAAMVFRYWGDAHADVEQFAPLVDRNAGGISDRVLVEAVRARGWQATAFTGSLEAIADHLKQRRPIIVLLHDRARRYHYVVVTGVDGNRVTVHDPSWGPSREIRVDEFEQRWQAARSWSLLIVPKTDGEVRLKPDAPYSSRVPAAVMSVEIDGASGFSRTSIVETPAVGAAGFSRTSIESDSCEARLEAAIADVREQGLVHADAILGRVRDACPSSAGPLRELAGVRFAERRWADAAVVAQQALAIDAGDAYAINVLGSSLFMLDDQDGALRAWNRIGKPRLDAVRIDGLRHTRYETVAAAVGLRPNAVLTPEAFALAERRVNALPDRSSARVTLRPGADGYATVDAVVAERAFVPRRPAAWAGLGILAALDREATISVPGFSGQGDVWSASWRWWEKRPRVAIGVAAPRFGGFPGVVRVDASWEQETLRVGSSESPALVTQTHVRGGLALSDWLTSNLRYSIGSGLDSWDSRRKAISMGATIERRLLDDRVALVADATSWLPIDRSAAFHATGIRMTSVSALSATRESEGRRPWAYASAIGIDWVSDAAPLGVWPGAGEGRARPPLLRAHPLLDEGIVDATAGSAFGRTLSYANAEIQRWMNRPTVVRIGVAAFADAAMTRRGGPDSRGVSNVDVGGGLRIKLPMRDRILRVDVARGLSDGAKAITIGWLF